MASVLVVDDQGAAAVLSKPLLPEDLFLALTAAPYRRSPYKFHGRPHPVRSAPSAPQPKSAPPPVAPLARRPATTADLPLRPEAFGRSRCGKEDRSRRGRGQSPPRRHRSNRLRRVGADE